MRAIIGILSLAFIAVASLSRESGAATGNNCLDQTDGQVLLEVVRTLASDPTEQDTRDSLGLPTLADSLIHLVASDSLCAVAAQKFTQNRGDAVAHRSVWVISWGPDYYVVFDPHADLGEWNEIHFYTKEWVLKSKTII